MDEVGSNPLVTVQLLNYRVGKVNSLNCNIICLSHFFPENLADFALELVYYVLQRTLWRLILFV
jgi:hypothetical protein